MFVQYRYQHHPLYGHTRVHCEGRLDTCVK